MPELSERRKFEMIQRRMMAIYRAIARVERREPAVADEDRRLAAIHGTIEYAVCAIAGFEGVALGEDEILEVTDAARVAAIDAIVGELRAAVTRRN
jgi:hypothetical protein